MRGRLINPFRADIRQLDTEATEAAKGGHGYDEDFKEPSPVDKDGDGEGPGVSTRAEKPALLIPAQVEMGTGEKLRQFFQGNDPVSRLVLIFHFRDLEKMGLVDDRGNARLRIGDRLAALYPLRGSCTETTAAWTPVEPVFAVEVQPNGFGIGLSRNLLFMFFESRDKAAGP
jgi:hypothetical protein